MSFELVDGELPPPIETGQLESNPVIEVGGVELTPQDFTISEEGISFSEEFLSALPDGEYSIVMELEGEFFETNIILENGVPLSAFPWETVVKWSMFNLVMTILSTLFAVMYLFASKKKDYKDEETNKGNKKRRNYKNRSTIFLIVLSVITIALLTATQDFTNPRGMYDGYSIVFAGSAIMSFLVILLSKTRKNDNEDRGNETI